MLPHTYIRPAKRMYTRLMGGHMNREHTQGRTSLRAKSALALLIAIIIATSLIVLGSGSTLASASPALPAASLPGRPLAELLNPDGTLNLNTGYSGTLNPAGWQLSGGLDGSPRFVPTAPGDENWDARFNPLGTDNLVYA